MPKKTRADYEEWLNEVYSGDEALAVGEYMPPQARFDLARGKYGTALRKHDPIAFNTGFFDFCRNKEGELEC